MDTCLFSDRISSLMKRDKLSRAAVAEKAGLSLTRLSNILTGNAGSVGADVIIGLCSCFDVSADYLLGLTDSPSTVSDVRAIADYTGLSDSFIQSVHYEKARYGHSYLAEFFDGDGDLGRFETLMQMLAFIADLSNGARYIGRGKVTDDMIDKRVIDREIYACIENGSISKDIFERLKIDLLQKVEGVKLDLVKAFLKLLDDFSESYYGYGGIHHNVFDEVLNDSDLEASDDGEH